MLKKLLRLLFILISIGYVYSIQVQADVFVKGYTKKNGTYVAPHYRSNPDGNFYNNWSTKGNINPHTGEEGTKTHPSNSNQYQSLPKINSGTYKTIDGFTESLDANRENANAQTDLGWMYEHGEGVPQNYMQALNLYTKAANQGNAVAQFNLGNMYFFGRGVMQDYNKAFDLFFISAKQGNVLAKTNLGWMYYKGLGTEQNYQQAYNLSVDAALQGESNAQQTMGEIYKHGDGVSQNNAVAYMWYSLAVLNGNKDAEKNIDEILEYITSAEVEQGNKMIQDLLKNP